MLMCVEVCFVVEATYLEALLHMVQHFIVCDTYLHIWMHVSTSESAFVVTSLFSRHKLHTWMHVSPSKCHLTLYKAYSTYLEEFLTIEAPLGFGVSLHIVWSISTYLEACFTIWRVIWTFGHILQAWLHLSRGVPSMRRWHVDLWSCHTFISSRSLIFPLGIHFLSCNLPFLVLNDWLSIWDFYFDLLENQNLFQMVLILILITHISS